MSGDTRDVGDVVSTLLGTAASIVSSTPTSTGGGRNSRTWTMQAGGRLVFVKETRRDDKRDRTACEVAFASFLRCHGWQHSPVPIAHDAAARIAVYEQIDGTAIDIVTAEHVAQAAAFARALRDMAQHADAASLIDAADAAFDLADHIAIVDARVQRVAAECSSGPASSFVADELVPAWRAVRDEAKRHAEAGAGGDRVRALSAARVLSPSDFGFHNALVQRDGRLVFFDFEYAGWDHPAKMLVDFFLQPAHTADRSFIGSMADAIAGPADVSDLLAAAAQLHPVLVVKWAAIALNALLPPPPSSTASQPRGDVDDYTQLAPRTAAALRVARTFLTRPRTFLP